MQVRFIQVREMVEQQTCPLSTFIPSQPTETYRGTVTEIHHTRPCGDVLSEEEHSPTGTKNKKQMETVCLLIYRLLSGQERGN